MDHYTNEDCHKLCKQEKQGKQKKQNKPSSATQHAKALNHKNFKKSRLQFISDRLKKQRRAQKVSARVKASRETTLTTKSIQIEKVIDRLYVEAYDKLQHI